MRAAGTKDVAAFKGALSRLLRGHARYEKSDLERWAEEASENPKLAGVTYRPDKEDILRMYLGSDILAEGANPER